MRGSIHPALWSIAVLATLLFAGAGCHRSIGALPAEYQELLDKAVADSGAPGGVMGVFCDDFWGAGASGLANLDSQKPMTPDTHIRLASMTKTFTAVLVLKLADEGLIALDDTLEKWIPQTFPDGNDITVSMLLNHTSGLHDHQSTPEIVDSVLNTPERVWTREEVLDLIAGHPVDFTPGTSYSYSNAGYYVLGEIIERVSGMTVQEALHDRVLKFIFATRTEVKDGSVAEPAADFYSVLLGESELSNVTNLNLSYNWTAGSGVSTAPDMIRFLHHIMGPCLLSACLRKEMTTVREPADQYGYGMNVKTHNGMVILSHGGANPGNFGTWAYIPDINAGFFIGLNRLDLADPSGISDQMQSVIDTMAELLLAQAGA